MQAKARLPSCWQRATRAKSGQVLVAKCCFRSSATITSSLRAQEEACHSNSLNRTWPTSAMHHSSIIRTVQTFGVCVTRALVSRASVGRLTFAHLYPSSLSQATAVEN